MIRKLTSILLLSGCGLAMAAPIIETEAPAAKPPTVNRGSAPVLQLRMGVDSLLAFMNQDPRPAPAAIARFLDNEIAPYFDFNHMARSAGGRLYPRLSPEQRSAMAEEIKRMFLTGLSERLVSYGGQRVRYLPVRMSPDGQQAVVGMMILEAGQYYPSKVDFRLLRKPGGWSIIDLAANGQSAVVYYRQALMRETMFRQYQQMQRRRYQSAPSSFRPRW